MVTQGAQSSRLEEELARNAVERLQSEAVLRSTAAALQQELELQREDHSSEVRNPTTSQRRVVFTLKHKAGTQSAIQLPVLNVF